MAKNKNWTPETAASEIRHHMERGLADSVDEILQQHPELAVGRQAYEDGLKPKSRGSGPVAAKRPAW